MLLSGLQRVTTSASSHMLLVTCTGYVLLVQPYPAQNLALLWQVPDDANTKERRLCQLYSLSEKYFSIIQACQNKGGQAFCTSYLLALTQASHDGTPWGNKHRH